MSFDVAPALSSFSDIYDEIKSLNSLSPEMWTLQYENAAANSWNLNTTAGIENTTNRVAVFQSKASGNNLGTEDEKYMYVLVEDDTANTRLIIRVADSVSAVGVNSDVTPLASAAILDQAGFPKTLGLVLNQDQFGIQLRSPSNQHAFALAGMLTGINSAFIGNDIDKRFFVTDTSQTIWCLPTSLYPAQDYELKVPVAANAENFQFQAFSLFPVATYDQLAGDTFIGFLSGAYLINNTNIDPYDALDVSATWYRVFGNETDSNNFALKEN